MIRKAVIPIAGLGTRLAPLTAAVPKALLPLMDTQGRLRAVIQLIVEEALSVAEELAIVVSPGQDKLLARYFQAAAKTDRPDLPDRISYIEQPSPGGFGDAVAQARRFVAGESFMLLLGDHVYQAAGGDRCASQVAKAFASLDNPAAVVGMQDVDEQELCRVGVAAGRPLADNLYRCEKLVEKPSIQMARAELATPALPPGRYLAHCGIYAFSNDIFECLAELSVSRQDGKEVELAQAQDMLLARRSNDYYLLRINGRAYDTGTPCGYVAGFDAMRARSH